MQLDHALWEGLRVEPGKQPGLAARPTSGSRLLGNTKTADRDLNDFTAGLDLAQERLYSTGSRALLVVLQGLDAAGKDGTIKHVMSGMNPQGCVVTSFKEPSKEELAHDFLWRAVVRLPPIGHIGIFNRSYYEDVLVERVHPDLLSSQPTGAAEPPKASFWRRRHDDINAFERHLDRNGTEVVKFFLHLSKRSSVAGFWTGWTTLPSTGSSLRRTWRSEASFPTTRRRTKRSWPRRRQSGRPGSSFRPTTSTLPVHWLPG